MQTIIHYSLHLVFPFFIAILFFRKTWLNVYLLFLSTMLVDLDHLLANPIFQANRCSVGFHYLHSLPAILFYVVLLFFKRPYRIIGIGLLFHMITDLIDCLFMFQQCQECYLEAPAYPVLEWMGRLLSR